MIRTPARRAHLALAPALALALALALVPGAGAHIDSPSGSLVLDLDVYQAYVTPQPSPVYANTSNQGILVQLVGPRGPMTDGEVRLEVVTPSGEETAIRFAPAEGGYWAGRAAFTETGNHSVRLTARGVDGEGAANGTLEVFADLPFRLRPVDPSQDIAAAVRTTLAFETVHPIDARRLDAFADLEVVVEHYSPDHRTLLSTTTIDATRTGPGVFRIEHVFPAEGHYYLKFASLGGGFNTSDVPLQHINVNPAPEPVTPDRTPSAGAALAVLAAGGAALLARGRR